MAHTSAPSALQVAFLACLIIASFATVQAQGPTISARGGGSVRVRAADLGLDAIIADRVRIIMEQRAEQQAAARALAREAAERVEMAKALYDAQEASKQDGPQPRGGAQDYVVFPKSLPLTVRRQRFNPRASGGNYPRMPGVNMPKPSQFYTCPDLNSVTAFGATGNGQDDDSAAFEAASASGQNYIYVPPGKYRIGTNVAITKPLYVGMGAQLVTDKGVTLELRKRIKRAPHWNPPMGRIFEGDGKVRLKGKSHWIRYEWWMKDGGTEIDAMQAMVNTCFGICTVMQTRINSLTKSWKLKSTINVFSSASGLLLGDKSTDGGQGIVLRPGRYTKPLIFRLLQSFNSFAVKIKGGVSGADVQAGQILKTRDAVVFAPDESAVGNTISDAWVTHVGVTGEVQNSVVFQAQSAGHTLSNCLARVNFVLKTGSHDTSTTSSGLLFRGGAAATLDRTSVIFQALDAQMRDGQPAMSVLQNSAGSPAANLFFQLEAWGGGLSNTGKLADGAFINLQAFYHMGSLPQGVTQVFTVSGSQQAVTFGELSSAGDNDVMPTSPDKSQFNGGSPRMDQVIYVTAKLASAWPPGEVRTYYLWAGFARTAGSRIFWIPFRAPGQGIVVQGFSNEDSQDPGRIAVRLVNVASTTLDVSADVRFGVQVGP